MIKIIYEKNLNEKKKIFKVKKFLYLHFEIINFYIELIKILIIIFLISFLFN